MVMCLSIGVIKVSANRPSNMILSYDNDTDQLNVTMTHLTSGSPGHYIDNVTIRVNGIMVHSQTYSSQPSSTTFTDQYLSIVADIGDTINVWARCHFSHDTLTGQLVVGAPPGSSIPGYLGIWIGFIVCIGIMTPLIYQKIRKGNYSWG